MLNRNNVGRKNTPVARITAIPRARLALLSLAATVALAACGGAGVSSAPSTAATSTPAVVATTAPAATATPPALATATTPASAATDTPVAADTATPQAAATAQAVVPAAGKLNLNTVTSDELMATIPGFSSRMVREFQEYRPYVSIQQFRKEIGKYVDTQTVTQYEQYVYVPVDVNTSDAATLQQLPGVDETIAAQLIAGRPYASNEAFLQALTASVSADQASAAAAYLVAS